MAALDERRRRLGKLSPSEKVSVAIDMVDASLGIAAEGIRAENPGISDEEMLTKLRERVNKRRWESRV